MTFKKPIITRVSPLKTRIRKFPFVENGPPRLRTKIQWKTLCLKLKIVLSFLLGNVFDDDGDYDSDGDSDSDDYDGDPDDVGVGNGDADADISYDADGGGINEYHKYVNYDHPGECRPENDCLK